MTGFTYTDADWHAENQTLLAGGNPPPCPRCGRRGFYAPRWAEPDRHYRACKFCGFWQNVDSPPHEIIRYECTGHDHCVADWKEPHESWACPICGTSYTPTAAVPWPAHNPKHCWNKAPASGTQADFAAFWTNNGFPAPHFGIP